MMKNSISEKFSDCRRLYKDIIKGYSYVPSHDFYIKHFMEVDIGEINEIKERIYADAKRKGLTSEEEKVEFLIKNELWTNKQEQEIESLEGQIEGHQQAKTKLFIKTQLDAVQGEIDKKDKKLKELNLKRISVIGLTLERFSEKKSSEHIIRLALFKDKKLETPFFTEEDYEELEPSELEQFIEIYSIKMSEFSNENIKMISAAGFLMNTLMLCKNNPFIFFGEPACKLTNFQLDVFSHALSYKSVLEKGRTPPQGLHVDLEKMVEWYESAGHVERISEKAKDRDGSTVMGASKEELRMMTQEGEEVIDLAKEAEKKGGDLNMKDFIRLHSKD